MLLSKLTIPNLMMFIFTAFYLAVLLGVVVGSAQIWPRFSFLVLTICWAMVAIPVVPAGIFLGRYWKKALF